MRLAALLPHLGQFGGVRRFLELGNLLLEQGNNYAVYAFDTHWTEWMRFDGDIRAARRVRDLDVLFCGDTSDERVMDLAEQMDTRLWMWCIASAPEHLKRYQKHARSGRWEAVICNNPVLAQHFDGLGLPVHVIPGAVNLETFRLKPLRVGYYEGRGNKSSTYVGEVLSGLPFVTPVPMSGLSENDLVDTYHSLDWFVSWELPGGWSNMSAEALACGVHVVTNGVNCEPFTEHCHVTNDLPGFFESLVTRLVKFSCRTTTAAVCRAVGIPNSLETRDGTAVVSAPGNGVNGPKETPHSHPLHLPPSYRSRIPTNIAPATRLGSTRAYAQWDVYELASRIPHKWVLDLGCGAASKTRRFFPPERTFLIDRPEMLATVAWEPHQSVAANLEYGFLRESGKRLLELSQLVVVCADVVEHLVDPIPLLNDLHELLRRVPGCSVVLSTPDREELARAGLRTPLGPPSNCHHAQEWTVDEFERLLRAQGFDERRVHFKLPSAKGAEDAFTQAWVLQNVANGRG